MPDYEDVFHCCPACGCDPCDCEPLDDDEDFDGTDDCPFCEGENGGCIECDYTGLYR